MRAYGIRTNKFNLPAPDRQFTLERLISTLQTLPQFGAKIMVTGNGRVSHGAQHVLAEEGETKRDDENYMYVAAWEYKGEGVDPELHKEPLVYENIKIATRNYKD